MALEGMRLIRITAGLGLLLLLVIASPLCADTPADEAPLMEEPIPHEAPPGEEPVPQEPALSEEPVPGEEPALSMEPVPGEEPALSEEHPPHEAPLLSEEAIIEDDEYFFVFEAPPLIVEVSPIIETRSFSDIFPDIPPNEKEWAMSDTGLKYAFEKDGSPTLIPHPDSGIDLLGSIMQRKPSHIIETLAVVPYSKRELGLLDIFNALGRIEKLKDHSIPVNGRDFYIFTDTTRIEGARNRKPIPDPPPAETLPYAQTMYLRFTDKYMGDLYIRGDISVSLYGITYSITNYTDIRYSLFRIMKAERYLSAIYFEPVKEGILIYSLTGLYLPGFIASRINLTPNINVRISALISWVTEGLKIQENSP